MLILVLLLLLPPLARSLSTYPIVRTSYGAVRGYEYQAKNGFAGEIYKKIPYASPPTGERRWRKPAPPEPWNHTLDGTFYGPACAQVPSYWEGYVTGTSEDCLTLNIYTSRECRESNAACPVVVYVHGGAALFSGNTVFPDEKLVTNYAKQGVIMVTVSYRLGIFGVMALGDENVLPANLALHDIVQSLRFVRAEIHNFGGNKDQVTIMGQSTGATIVLALVFSPAVNTVGKSPLFSRAIAMSASMNLETEASQVNKSHVVAAKLGCSGTAQEIVHCMRFLSTDEIITAASAVGGSDMFSPSHLSGVTLAGEFLPFRNMRELRENQENHMKKLFIPTKLLLGTMLSEFNAGPLRGLVNNINTGINQVTDVLGVRNKEECVQKYFNDVESRKFDPGYDTLSQTLFITTSLFASTQAQTGAEVYLYQFDYPTHAWHADDVYYALGSQPHPVDDNEEWLSRLYPVYFTNFIRGLPPAPDWERFDPDLMNYYSINKNISEGVVPEMRFGYHQDLTDYYNAMVQFDENLTSFKQKMMNAPIQYKRLALHSSKPFNVFFYGIVIGFVIIVLRSFNLFWRKA